MWERMAPVSFPKQTRTTDMSEDMGHLQLTTRYRKLKPEEKTVLVMELLETSTNGRLQYGALKLASVKRECSVHTVYRV